MQESILKQCELAEIRGTILLAEEGINGTIAGKHNNIDKLINWLQSHAEFADLQYKDSFTDEIPFHRMKVRLKKEIVSMGVPGVNTAARTGIKVKAKDWNKLIEEPDILLIDTRNEYECEIGMFEGAVSPGTESFREFPAYVKRELKPDNHKRVAMYCTGGIRCEKASAYMIEQGFKEVYQLDGGILKYLEETESSDSMWKGDCFVFDGRVAVDGNLESGNYLQCFACRRPLSEEDCASEYYEEGISCPACYKDLSESKRAAVEERQKQVKLAEQRNQQHIGARMPAKGSKS